MKMGNRQKKAYYVNKRKPAACLAGVLVLVAALSFFYINRNGKTEAVNAGTQEEAAGTKGKIALTFDDGPDSRYTEELLDGLKERGVKATFFVTGAKAEENPGLIKRMQEEGHLIGNHTYSHMQLKEGMEEQFKQELIKTSDIIEKLTGEGTEYVRPPYGVWEKNLEKELNMFPVLWTVDPLDWCSKDADGVTRKVVSKAKENDIILMHDQYKSSVTAALQIVDALQKQGYEFVTVEEILFD